MKKVYNVYYNDEWTGSLITFKEIEDELDDLIYDLVRDEYQGFDRNFYKDMISNLKERSIKQLLEKGECDLFNQHIEIVEVKLNKEIEDILDKELEDDETENGGIEFTGETVLDFMNEVGEQYSSIEELNRDLKECGIKPIKVKESKIVSDLKHNVKMLEKYM